ncbi:PepSY-associated TM helix domain-containing protein [Thermomonospora amylolytica]|uniref:PepSY-associated TM helix domain-containing protein n=1 Tax=Thermomonospora amylolytica TaxID=1411117 RepID=UPI000E6B6BC0|nr:PepSY domain-containing protein [Thermomonospora amylolytica]
MTAPVIARPDAETTAPPRRAGWAALRPLVLRLHFYAGILIAPFLLVAALTGLLYATSFQVEKVVYRHELTVPARAAQVPLAQQVAAARAEHPEGTVTAVRPSAGPGQTTRVLLNVPGLAESTQLAVFVDPHTGRVRGTLESYGGSGALPVRAWISSLHRNLHLGETGRLYSELAASWLWVVALGGLLLWLGRRRSDRRLRRLLAPERGTRGLRRLVSWHGAIGLWAVAGLLFLSATGLTWSKYAGENVDELRTALGWSTPAISASSGDHGSHAHGAGASASTARDVGVDQVLRAASAKGLSGPLEVVWPGEDGTYVVKEIDKQWPQRLDQVAVDPATGHVVAELRFADYPLAAKLTRWGIDGHMGLLFGLVNQLLLAALAAGVITLIVLGYRMWWRRRPTRGFARPYQRGAWRQVHWAVLVPLAAIALGVGYFLPLMGISLAAFLLIDALLGLRSRKAAAAAPTVPQPATPSHLDEEKPQNPDTPETATRTKNNTP